MNQIPIAWLCLAALAASAMAVPLPQGIGGVAGAGVASNAGGVSAVAGVSASGSAAVLPLQSFAGPSSVGGPSVDNSVPVGPNVGAPVGAPDSAPVGSPVGAPFGSPAGAPAGGPSFAPTAAPASFGPGGPGEGSGPFGTDVNGGGFAPPFGGPIDPISHAVNQAGVSFAQAISESIAVALNQAVGQATGSLAAATGSFN